MSKTEARITWLDETETIVKISTGDKMRVNKELPAIPVKYETVDEVKVPVNLEEAQERNIERFERFVWYAAKRSGLPNTQNAETPEDFFDNVYEIDLVVAETAGETPSVEGESGATPA